MQQRSIVNMAEGEEFLEAECPEPVHTVLEPRAMLWLDPVETARLTIVFGFSSNWIRMAMAT